ncbi:MAG: hypothetical protein ACOCP8_05860 [archaeon]
MFNIYKKYKIVKELKKLCKQNNLKFCKDLYVLKGSKVKNYYSIDDFYTIYLDFKSNEIITFSDNDFFKRKVNKLLVKNIEEIINFITKDISINIANKLIKNNKNNLGYYISIHPPKNPINGEIWFNPIIGKYNICKNNLWNEVK